MRRVTARGVAAACLVRIDGGAYANLALPPMLARSGLSTRDRGFATELVYGTTRMRRACDWLVDRHVPAGVDLEVRALLRLGAYQLAFAGTPAHAAVSATVAEAPFKVRGLLNAVLRKVARALPPAWPDRATELSYPDWVVARLEADLGADRAVASMRSMNLPAVVHERPDGYVQDPSSQAVAGYVAGLVPAGGVVVELCAAPGGKATALASSGAGLVVAGDVRPRRSALVAANSRRLALDRVAVVVADGRAPALRGASADVVLVDAPCSGLGALRRRPDARWRARPAAVNELAGLQRQLLGAAAALTRPGGALVYSVCTLTAAETLDQDRWLAAAFPGLGALPPPSARGWDAGWEEAGRGGLLLPQAGDNDGMYCLGLRAPCR